MITLHIIKKTLKSIWIALVVVTFASLLLDSYRNPESFVKLTGITSEALFLASLIGVYIVTKIDVLSISSRLSVLLRWMCCFFGSVGIGLTFVDVFTSPNTVFGLTQLNYQKLIYITLLSGWILFWSSSRKWRLKHEDEIKFVGGFILLFVAYIFSLWPLDVFIKLSAEDRLVENAQAIVLAIGSIYAFSIAKHFLPRKLYILASIFGLISVGLFAVSGDEIAWGQRFLQLTTPEYFEANNMQKEITFHNLEQFHFSIAHIYMVVGLWGWASWPVVNLFRNTLPSWIWYFIPSLSVFPYFFSAFLFNARTLMGPHDIGTWSEFMELMLYIGFAMYVYQKHFMLKKQLNKG